MNTGVTFGPGVVITLSDIRYHGPDIKNPLLSDLTCTIGGLWFESVDFTLPPRNPCSGNTGMQKNGCLFLRKVWQ